jgi:hypothetical protein
VLVWRNPWAKCLYGKILAKGVIGCGCTTFFAAFNRPAVDFIATGNDTVIASRGDHIRICRGQRDVLVWDIIWS